MTECVQAFGLRRREIRTTIRGAERRDALQRSKIVFVFPVLVTRNYDSSSTSSRERGKTVRAKTTSMYARRHGSEVELALVRICNVRLGSRSSFVQSIDTPRSYKSNTYAHMHGGHKQVLVFDYEAMLMRQVFPVTSRLEIERSEL